MKIKIKFFSPVREIIQREEEEIEIKENSTIGELLDKLEEKYKRSFRKIPCVILVNNTGVNLADGEKTKLKEGDLVTFLPMLSGG